MHSPYGAIVLRGFAGGGDNEVVEEADLRDSGEVGEATGEIKVAFAWFEVAGWMVVCSIKTIVNPIVCLPYL